MYSKVLKWVEVAVLGVSTTAALIVLLMLIRGLGSPLWTQEASGWAQAIGSVVAIGAAYYLGERQAQAALQTVHEADKVAATRKFDSVLAVADSAYNYAKQVSKAFSGKRASFLHLEILYSENFMSDVINALQVVPAHELGSYDAVTAMLALRNAMNDLHGNIKRAVQKCESEAVGSIFPTSIEFDKTAIDLCLSKIEECLQSLHEERATISG